MTATTKRFFIILCLLIITTAALLMLVRQLQLQRVALVEALQTIENEAAVARTAKSLTAVLEESKDERAEIASYVLNGEAEAITFLTTIEDLARLYQVELSSTRLETAMNDTFKTPVVIISFSFLGPRASTEAYLTALEVLPYASFVERSTLVADTDEAGRAFLRGDLTVQAAVQNIDI